MIAKMDCQPLSICRKNKEQIYDVDLIHISTVHSNQNNQLLVEVHVLMFWKNSNVSDVRKIPVYTCVSNKLRLSNPLP